MSYEIYYVILGEIMAAYVKFVKPEHADIIREYLSEEGTILVMPEMQKTLINMGIDCSSVERYPTDYDFGGESDKMVDIVSNDDHYFINYLTGE